MEFSWILRKYRIHQKSYHIMLNLHISSFFAFEFPRGLTQLHRICKGKALFCPEFPRIN